MMRVGHEISASLVLVQGAIFLHVVLASMKYVHGKRNEVYLEYRKLANGQSAFNFDVWWTKHTLDN